MRTQQASSAFRSAPSARAYPAGAMLFASSWIWRNAPPSRLCRWQPDARLPARRAGRPIASSLPSDCILLPLSHVIPSMAIVKLKLLSSRRAADVPTTAAPTVAAADEDDLPIPSDIKAVFLGGLFLLAMLGACYVASDIVLPIVLAFVLSLVLQPAMRALERVRLPRGIAAVFLILLLFGTLGGLGAALSGPAASWAQKLPSGIPKLEERLSFLSRPIAAFQKFADHAQGITLGGEPKAVPVTVQGSGLSERLLSGTRSFASGLLETVLVLFFLLVSGDTFLRRLVEICRGSRTSGR